MRQLLMLFAATVLSCRSSAPLNPEPQSAGTFPIAAAWQVKDERHVTFVLTKKLATGKDLTVTLKTPEAVKVSPALSTWRIGAKQTGTFSTSFELSWEGEGAPKEDLVAIVDMQSESSGYHAEIAYRFGREEPALTQPKGSGEDVRVGNSRLGQPIELKNQQQSAPQPAD